MSQENVEVIRASYDAWNAGDMDALREIFNACEPYQPAPANYYFDCAEARGSSALCRASDAPGER